MNPRELHAEAEDCILTSRLMTFAGFAPARCLTVFFLPPSTAVPVWAAEPAGERPADRGGARQAVQQHPGDRLPPHVPVERGHAARPEESQGGPGAAGPHRAAPGLQEGQS